MTVLIQIPTTEESVPLPDLLSYDPETGVLTWGPRPREMFAVDWAFHVWNARFAGKEAFTSIDSHRYRAGEIFSRRYLAHRVIWALVHGEWPSGQIDHIDGCRTNNRLDNLRSVTRAENGRNQKFRSTNTSGAMGVDFLKANGKWRARIMADGRPIHLGYFRCPTAATVARKAAEKKYGFHENHGRN